MTATTASRPTDLDLLLIPVADADAARAAAHGYGTVGERAAEGFEAKPESRRDFFTAEGDVGRVVLCGTGPSPDREALRRAAAKGIEVAADGAPQRVGILLPATLGEGMTAADAACALVEGATLGTYRFDAYKTDAEDREPHGLVVIGEGEGLDAAARRGAALADAACAARDLVNLSPHEKTATLLAEAFAELGEEAGFDVDIWDEARVRDEGMGGLLAVARGSQEPPTFTTMTWKPDNAVNDRPVVLVGKGVVYDTGGLSLKPTLDSMDKMKSDMAGSAAVAGTMHAVATLRLPLWVVALVPACDNRPGENAYVPGEVVTMHSGATVEVMNTDAEGRMLLADALSHARSLEPMLTIDVATLTGAVVVALGNQAAAVMHNDAGGAHLDRIAGAGERAGERVHPLPMFDAYRKQLDSDIADLKNVGGRMAGTITAGKFLEHFVDYPWMHVDIAGVAFTTTPQPYRPKGGTGWGVRLLTEFLTDLSRA